METARKTFEEGSLASDLPTTEIQRSLLDAGIPAYELLRQAGLAASNGEARRLIKGGGARINDVAIADELHAIGVSALNSDGIIKLSAGRKRHALVKAV
jgi:tyrosyl-tRNA synthetase